MPKAAPSSSGTSLQPLATTPPALTEEELENIQKALEEIGNKLLPEKSLTNAVSDSLEGIFKSVENINQFPVEDAVKLLDEEMIAKVEEKVKTEQEHLAAENKKAQEQTANYSKQMEDFNPFGYLDTEQIGLLSDTLREQLSVVAGNMNETGEEYLEFTDEVYASTQEHTQLLTENIAKTYDITSNNVQVMVETAKNARSNLNEQNEELLETFTKRLPYTRQGSIAARSVYDFVVAPIEVKGVYETTGQRVREKPEIILNRLLLILILIEGMLFAGSAVFYSIQNKANKTNE